MKGTENKYYRNFAVWETSLDYLEEMFDRIEDSKTDRTDYFFIYSDLDVDLVEYIAALDYRGLSGPLMKIILGKDEI